MSGVLLVSGDQALLRIRFVTSIIQSKEKAGWRINRIDASLPGAVSHAVSGDFFFTGKALVVVQNPEKGDVKLYEEHAQEDSGTTLLLHLAGNPHGGTRFGKFVKANPKWHKAFRDPEKTWDRPPVAAAFAIKEAREQYGKALKEPLARALVHSVGTDTGVLALEILKMATLADAEGSGVITKEHVQECRATLMEATLDHLITALRDRKRKAVAQQLARIYRTTKKSSKGGPVFRVTRAIQKDVFRWLSVTTLKGLPPEEAAKEAGENPWYYRNKMLPVAKVWKREQVIQLIKILARSERALPAGHQQPWSEFCAGLLGVC